MWDILTTVYGADCWLHLVARRISNTTAPLAKKQHSQGWHGGERQAGGATAAWGAGAERHAPAHIPGDSNWQSSASCRACSSTAKSAIARRCSSNGPIKAPPALPSPDVTLRAPEQLRRRSAPSSTLALTHSSSPSTSSCVAIVVLPTSAPLLPASAESWHGAPALEEVLCGCSSSPPLPTPPARLPLRQRLPRATGCWSLCPGTPASPVVVTPVTPLTAALPAPLLLLARTARFSVQWLSASAAAAATIAPAESAAAAAGHSSITCSAATAWKRRAGPSAASNRGSKQSLQAAGSSRQRSCTGRRAASAASTPPAGASSKGEQRPAASSSCKRPPPLRLLALPPLPVQPGASPVCPLTE